MEKIDEIKTKNKKSSITTIENDTYIKDAGSPAKYLTVETHEFYLRLDELLKCDEVVVKHNKNIITYFPNTGLKQQPLVLRNTFDSNGLIVELKLNFIGYYTSIIEKMPEHIKAVFCNIKHCRYKKCNQGLNCGMRRTWTLDGIHYYLCSFKFYFCPDVLHPEDAVYYAEIIIAEAKAAIERKKHITGLLE